MKRSSMARSMLESTVRRALREMREDSARQLRRLVDLGCQLMRGGNRKKLFSYIQSVLQNEQGAYYTMLQELLCRVDEERLCTFGINFGYNGCVEASEKLRRGGKKYGHELPWSTGVDLSQGMEETIRAVDEGASLGQAVFMLAVPDKASLLSLGELLERHGEAVFFLFLAPDIIEEETVAFCTRYPQLWLSLELDGEKAEDEARLLREARLLFGMHLSYSQDSAWRVTTGEALSRTHELGGFAAFVYPIDGCREDTLAEVERAVLSERAEPSEPVLVMDLYSDVAKINAMISEGINFGDCSAPSKPWRRAASLGEALLRAVRRKRVRA